MRTSRLLLATLATLAFTSIAAAQTITVTTSDDAIDVPASTATVADLPGPDGEVSFSEALIASNNTPGRQTIGFAIPESEWPLQFLYPGRAVLTTLVGYYWRAYDEVTIDGTTQTAATGDTHAGGAEVVLYGSELYLNAGNCTVVGLDSSSITVTGSSGLVEDNTSVNVTVWGDGNLIRRNTGGTIKIDRASDNVVVGNTVNRVRVLGWTGGGEPCVGNRIGGPTLAERNHVTGYGTWNSEGLPSGITVQLADTIDLVIENNWIGTTPDGLAQGNLASTIGIGFQGENSNTTVRGNRIAGILGHGMGPHHAGQLFGYAVLIAGTGTGLALEGNTIGLDANDEPLLGSVWGISIGDAVTNPSSIADIRIGGPNPGQGNEIAGHILNGVTVGRDVVQVRLQGNEIHQNGWLGIDLVPLGYGYGVTANDPLDADGGGNGLQNFPVLTAAVADRGTRVTGTLHSSPLASFTLDFFASPACDESGFGEGELYLGSAAVATDAGGDASFDVAFPVLATPGWSVTATATLEPVGKTSEFSACVPVSAGPRFPRPRFDRPDRL